MGLLRAIRPWNEWIAGWGFDIKAGEPDLSAGAPDPWIFGRLRRLRQGTDVCCR